MESKTNVCGVISLVLGIIGMFILPLWLGIASLILGLVGISQVPRCNSGKGISIAGAVLGAISLIWYFANLAILAAII